MVFRDFQDEIEYLSFHDHLTGLYNRRFFEAELKRLDTKRNWPLTIVMGDVNGLKMINDSFEHAIGDQLLIKAAEALREEAHSKRVSELCFRMGEALGLEEYKIKELKASGLLHDIGKIAISDSILNKPGVLTDNELIEMKRHSEIGYRILSTANHMSEIAEYVLAHYERWDGNGYPKGLKGEAIPFESRIIAIADAYDAMTSKRSYNTDLPKDVALAELRNNAGKQFDPELIRLFIQKVLRKVQKCQL